MKFKFLLFLFLSSFIFGDPYHISLRWEDTSDTEEGFKIYVREGTTAPFEMLVDIKTPNVEKYDQVLDVTGGEHFEYYVIAYHPLSKSDPSNIAILNIPSLKTEGWIYWRKGDGGAYAYSEDFGWGWTNNESLPYIYSFKQGKWVKIKIP